MQKVIITNLLNNIIGVRVTQTKGVFDSLNIASQIDDLLKDDNYVYLLCDVSKDNSSLLLYQSIVKNVNRLVNDKRLRIVFVGEIEDKKLLESLLVTFNEGIISDYYDMLDNKITFIFDKKDIFKVLKRDKVLDKEIHVLINDISDINMVDEARKNNANLSVIGNTSLDKKDIIFQYVLYTKLLDRYKKVKTLIKNGVINDFDDEVGYKEISSSDIEKEENKLNKKIDNNKITLEEIKSLLIKLKLIYDYTDSNYLRTSMSDINTFDGLGSIIIPNKVLDLDVYDSFKEYKKTLLK